MQRAERRAVFQFAVPQTNTLRLRLGSFEESFAPRFAKNVPRTEKMDHGSFGNSLCRGA